MTLSDAGHANLRKGIIGLGCLAIAGYGAFYMHRLYYRQRRKIMLTEYREGLLVSTEKLKEIRDEFLRQMELGLEARGQSTLMTLPTMIDVLPTGSESGVFYALDMGGTNFRVVTINLSKKKNRVGDVDMRSFPITPAMKLLPVDELFDEMASKLVAFATECGNIPSNGDGIVAAHPVVGFCFSFPVQQTAIDAGKIIVWTKGFRNKGAIGSDPVKLLGAALKRQGMHAEVKVLINDTMGVLAAGRYANPDAMIGLILGTGTNACYVEQVDRIKTMPEDYKSDSPLMCINLEWGNFTADCLPQLPEDIALDAASENPGDMTFEKLVSGMNLGEVACRIMLKMAVEGGLFGGRVPEALMGPPWAFHAGDVAAIHSDESHNLEATALMINEKFGLDINTLPYGCRRNVKYICKMVGQRAGSLVGAAIAALVRHMGRDVPSTTQGGATEGENSGGSCGEIPTTVIAMDGSLILKYDKFRLAIEVAIANICGKKVAQNVIMKATEDGSSIGAACLAAARTAR